MNFQCKSCGGNMVFDPGKQAMICPHCGGKNTETREGDDSLVTCAACGGQIEIGTYESSSRCPYCQNYLIFDSRVEGDYEPDLIIPFQLSKEKAIQAMEEAFKKRTFTPMSFLSQKTLESMKGVYVPFFFHDYDLSGRFLGKGKKVRSWRSGNYIYTETSIYEVERQMKASFQGIPVDASIAMDDGTMDLMEPYRDEKFTDFDPKYMSGFYGEVYNMPAEELRPRADVKANEYGQNLMRESLGDYSSLQPEVQEIRSETGKVSYGLLPVWVYKYRWMGKEYPFYVNGQTGKVVGVTPISRLKVAFYACSLGFFLGSILEMLVFMLGD
ncbi:MAG: hypothetical protein K6G62_02245 [Eubacterium sp.]|nr:hypothetical protein [Eubacterium sp.]